MGNHPSLHIRQLGLQTYSKVWEDMLHFTRHRTPETPDEFWCVEHFPVYTQGQAGRSEHLLPERTPDVPLVQSDRGGQITYHAPGQLVLYTLVDLKRQALTIKDLICNLEQSLLQCLQALGLKGRTEPHAPGVYVGKDKIASLGLRVKQGCSYHGLALNVNLDLSPFNGINPCGHAGMKMTSLENLGIPIKIPEVQSLLLQQLTLSFGYA